MFCQKYLQNCLKLFCDAESIEITGYRKYRNYIKYRIYRKYREYKKYKKYRKYGKYKNYRKYIFDRFFFNVLDGC